MLQFVTLVTALTGESDVTTVLLQTREMQLTVEQAKTLFQSDRRQHITVTQLVALASRRNSDPT